jgi:hypothetical protein
VLIRFEIFIKLRAYGAFFGGKENARRGIKTTDHEPSGRRNKN